MSFHLRERSINSALRRAPKLKFMSGSFYIISKDGETLLQRFSKFTTDEVLLERLRWWRDRDHSDGNCHRGSCSLCIDNPIR